MYNIIYNDVEIIDTASNIKEAVDMVKEYDMAFKQDGAVRFEKMMEEDKWDSYSGLPGVRAYEEQTALDMFFEAGGAFPLPTKSPRAFSTNLPT
tara:strand:- start:295 stop:576 length:282 start_codon:yes stop_codon:yes gene_type:complete